MRPLSRTPPKALDREFRSQALEAFRKSEAALCEPAQGRVPLATPRANTGAQVRPTWAEACQAARCRRSGSHLAHRQPRACRSVAPNQSGALSIPSGALSGPHSWGLTSVHLLTREYSPTSQGGATDPLPCPAWEAWSQGWSQMNYLRIACFACFDCQINGKQRSDDGVAEMRSVVCMT